MCTFPQKIHNIFHTNTALFTKKTIHKGRIPFKGGYDHWVTWPPEPYKRELLPPAPWQLPEDSQAIDTSQRTTGKSCTFWETWQQRTTCSLKCSPQTERDFFELFLPPLARLINGHWCLKEHHIDASWLLRHTSLMAHWCLRHASLTPHLPHAIWVQTPSAPCHIGSPRECLILPLFFIKNIGTFSELGT